MKDPRADLVKQCWRPYFQPGGKWEANRGRRQTRVFAEQFARCVKLDRAAPFSLLDAGCALGDAIRVFHRLYPRAILTGVDVSDIAISRCRSQLGKIATFEVADLGDLADHCDVIYASNVLEHFVDYRNLARSLLRRCKRLCIMTPFEQLDEEGRPLSPTPDSPDAHQHTFYRDTFDFLIREGLAESVHTFTVECPGAWGWDPRTLRRMRFFWWLEDLRRHTKNLFRRLKGKPPRPGPPRLQNALQIIYDILAADRSAGGEARPDR